MFFIKKLRILISIVFILLSIFLYLLLHGTKKLLIVNILNNIIYIIPVFSGINFHNTFINGYLVDILWFTSLIIISPYFSSLSYFINSILAFVIADIFELMQYCFPFLGTFDYFDLLCYLGIFIIYNLVYFIIRKISL